MRQIALLALLLAFAAAVYGQENILEKGLEGRSAADVISRRYVTPLRLVALPGELTAGVENPEALLRNFDGQLTTGTPDVCRLSTRDGRSASVLLDFGKELCGGIALSAAIRADQRALKVRIRLGESVSEAMSDVGGDAPMASATNEHSLRDFTLGVPWLGNVEAGNSGFRFVRIDLVEPDAELNLKAVRAILRYRDVPYLGSFRCDDERLNRIWETGAYTVHLNMQEYLWDGVKRDRLVWLGDMHPEVMTVQSVFGGNEVVRRSLDHVRDNTPLPGWMNWIAAYSMWWVIIHRDLYMYEGDLNYLGEQQEYMRALLRVLASQMDGDRENLQGGQRLLDWPTSQMPDVIHAGYQALMVMAMEAGAEIGGWLGDRQMQSECHGALRRLRRHVPDHLRNTQAAAMLVLAGLARQGVPDGDRPGRGGRFLDLLRILHARGAGRRRPLRRGFADHLRLLGCDARPGGHDFLGRPQLRACGRCGTYRRAGSGREIRHPCRVGRLLLQGVAPQPLPRLGIGPHSLAFAARAGHRAARTGLQVRGGAPPPGTPEVGRGDVPDPVGRYPGAPRARCRREGLDEPVGTRWGAGRALTPEKIVLLLTTDGYDKETDFGGVGTAARRSCPCTAEGGVQVMARGREVCPGAARCRI